MPSKRANPFPDQQVTNLTVSQNVAYYRAKAGLSLQQLADLLDGRLNKQQLYRIEHAGTGTRVKEITVTELVLLAKTFGVSPNQLLVPNATENTFPLLTGAGLMNHDEIRNWLYTEHRPYRFTTKPQVLPQ